MAARKKVKPAARKKEASKPKPEAPAATEGPADKPEAKPVAPAKATKATPAPRAHRAKPKKRKPVARKKPSPRPKRAAKRPRRRYSTAVKARILKVAVAESLTARQVQAKFGVKPVTYYSWRKAAKPASGRAVGQAGRGRPEATRLAGLVRESVQERLRGMLPKIVGAEVERYLSQAFSRSARSRSR